MNLRRIASVLLPLCVISCDALFPHGINPPNCVVNPGICDASQGQICNTVSERCETSGVCSAIAQCESPSAVQCKSGACVPCEADVQCQVWSSERTVTPALNFCVKPTGASGGTCGQCRASSDCSSDPAKAFCDQSTHVCRGCLQHSECDTTAGDGSGICYRPNDYPAAPANMVGRCVAAGPGGQIAYLGNNPAGCETMATNPSSVSKPYCTLAVAMASGKQYIKVLPSPTPYPAISLTNQTVTLIGPGRDANPGATFTSADVTGSGTLTLSDVVVVGSGTASIQCGMTSTGKINVIASNITGSGIDANYCAGLTVERTRLNTPGRLAIQAGGAANTVFRIVNSLVIESGSPGSPQPVRLGLNATGVFNYNTVTGSTGSVRCLQPFTIANSVLVNNGMLYEGCMAQTSVTDDMAAVLGAGPEPKLQNNQTAANLCIDRGEPPPAGDIQTDYFGNPRPKGKGLDKGYHELQ